MEKVSLFVSDIEGTLPPCNADSFESYTLFFKTLNDICISSGADRLLFSISSTGSKDEVIKKMEELSPYMIGLNIQFANGYCDSECFDRKGHTVCGHGYKTSKPSLMINQMARLQSEGNEIMWAGFADDLGELYPDIDEIASCFPDVPTKIIYPKFTSPLPFDHIISELENEVINFENIVYKK